MVEIVANHVDDIPPQRCTDSPSPLASQRVEEYCLYHNDDCSIRYASEDESSAVYSSPEHLALTQRCSTDRLYIIRKLHPSHLFSPRTVAAMEDIFRIWYGHTMQTLT